MADSPSPLCTEAQFSSGAFSDLASGWTNSTGQPLADLLVEATRACESECNRRLAPFTVTNESHRAEGMDPDEYTDSANLPMDLQGTLGRSYAHALGASTLVRHVWLNEFAPRYPDLWTYSVSQLQIVRSYGGSENLSPSQYHGPDADSGHVFLNLGIFAPIGSYFYATYSGGYTVATPGDLVRACKNMAAWMIVTELNPEDTQHDPDRLHATALMLLQNYDRS
jgi:hypothetical protein